MKTCVIVNPNAGSAEEFSAMRAGLSRLGEVTIWETKIRGDAINYAKQAQKEGFDQVVAAGGDGTLNEVVNGLADDFSRIRLGIIPLGTGNDFARTLELPLNDIAQAVQIVAEGVTRQIDLVRVQTTSTNYFINTAGVGFSAELGEKVESEEKARWGSLAYIFKGIASLTELKSFRARLTLDQNQERQISAYNIIFANGRFIAGGIPIAPEAQIDDGQIDVVIIPELPMLKLASMTAKLFAGIKGEIEELVRLRTSRVTIDCYPRAALNMDGELIGESRGTLTVVPGALAVSCRSASA